MSRTTKKEYWNEFWRNKKDSDNFYTFDLLSKYLPYNPKFDCIEIGCIPGRFMIAFNKMFGYKVSGIDFCDLTSTKRNLKERGINFELFEEDFEKFKPNKKYDVVSSFGFIEHFDNPDIQINKMIGMLKKGGYLVMGLPNFRHGQYILHKILDNQTFKNHYIEIMDLKVIKEIMKQHNLKTLYLGYYKPFQYWHSNKNKIMKLINFPLILFSNILNRFMDVVGMNLHFTNKYFSPYIVYIGRLV